MGMEATFAAHRELLQQLQATDYAVPLLAQLQRQLDMNRSEVAADQKTLEGLKRKTKDELKDWNDIKGRTLKRLWVKIKHPLHGRQRLTQLEEKEEKEYLAAFTTEKTAQARLEAAEAQISDLSKQVADVSRAAAQHDAVRAQLSQLYSSVFDGPTPAFPLEDIKEQAYNTALQQYNLTTMVNEKRALELLAQADQNMAKAEKIASSATDYATMNSYGGEDDWALVEKSEFAKAQKEMDQAKLFVQQAQQLEPGIPGLMEVTLPKGNLIADIFFDTLWSELQFRERADQAAADVKAARAALQNVIGHASAYTANLSQMAQQAQVALENARTDLENTRRDILLHGGEQGFRPQ